MYFGAKTIWATNDHFNFCPISPPALFTTTRTTTINLTHIKRAPSDRSTPQCHLPHQSCCLRPLDSTHCTCHLTGLLRPSSIRSETCFLAQSVASTSKKALRPGTTNYLRRPSRSHPELSHTSGQSPRNPAIQSSLCTQTSTKRDNQTSTASCYQGATLLWQSPSRASGCQ